MTKYASAAQVREALASGLVSQIGESRIQAAQAKKAELGEMAGGVTWRFIGHLQTNKARKAAELFDTVDSVDSARLADALEAALAGGTRRLPVLLQVKLTERESQSGVAPGEVGKLLAEVRSRPHLDVRGFLAIAPQTSSAEETRPHFRRMRGLFEEHFADRPDAELSMGMSGDFEVAVEEGATLIRLGSIVFS